VGNLYAYLRITLCYFTKWKCG